MHPETSDVSTGQLLAVTRLGWAAAFKRWRGGGSLAGDLPASVRLASMLCISVPANMKRTAS
jgi:hypothetical protein